MVIGRGSDADVSLDWDTDVSRVHAELAFLGGSVDAGRRRSGRAALEAVRRFTLVPESAMHVLGDGPRGDLSSGSDDEPGTTTNIGTALPANFRRYKYFGVAEAEGSTRELVLYDRVDRLTDPR